MLVGIAALRRRAWPVCRFLWSAVTSPLQGLLVQKNVSCLNDLLQLLRGHPLQGYAVVVTKINDGIHATSGRGIDLCNGRR
jgi:hypothetical protein